MAEITLGTLEALGFDPRDLEDQIVAKLVDQFRPSPEYQAKLKAAFDAKLDTWLAEKVIAKIDLSQMTITPTNNYGEPKGVPQTFLEYAIARAEKFLHDPVNHHGKSKAEGGSEYNERYDQTRINWLVENYLHEHLTKAMAPAIKDLDAQIAGGLAKAMQDAVAGFRVALVKTSK